ncbi:hypothetical protein [Virgibacillus halodenitrificans]|uniref:hypothetical protein n=1 Tax=Virgibacillus halodenitrificans TaxID=1482 RepID=UPI0002EE542F|nr:hypothetical protein [Virgibacillus halodenitrificans]
MTIQYGIYKNNIYTIDLVNGEIELTSHNPQDKIYSFKEYIDILGKEHPEILIKIVSETEISFAYKLEFKVLYKGEIFLPTAIGKFLLGNDSISIYSNNIEDMPRYGFDRIDKFIFEKEIALNDIDALIEYKVPILKFSDRDTEVNRINKENIREYISNLIE